MDDKTQSPTKPKGDGTHVEGASKFRGQDIFLKGTARMFQQAVKAIDLVNYAVKFGLSDTEISQILNNQALAVQQQAAKKYEAWKMGGQREKLSDIRDDVVAERIQQLPLMLAQYRAGK